MHIWQRTRCCHALKLQTASWLRVPGGTSVSPRCLSTTARRSIFALRTRSQQAACLHSKSKSSQSRAYTNQRQETAPSWSGAAILTRNTSHTSIEHIVDQIKPLSELDHRAEQPHVAVFLVSKAFAPWATTGGGFLSHALARLYSSPRLSANTDETLHIADVRVLAAVVDGIPTPSPLSTNTSRLQDLALGEEGQEGIAYCVFEEDVHFRIQELSSSFESFTQLGAIEQGTLSICLHPRDATLSTPLEVTSVTLPLASTVFSTGRAFTMDLSHWRWNSASKKFDMYLHKETAHQAVHLPVDTSESVAAGQATAMQPTHVMQTAISTPLVALTTSQRVEDCMGNIVRRLKRDDGTVFPASEELESSVAAFFKENQISPQPVSVWALVIGSSIWDNHPELLQRLQDGNQSEQPGSFDVFVGDFLKRGATLHRVISGGGGWGNKAGLLSLDANSAYGPSPLEGLQVGQASPKEDEGALDFEKMFGGVAAPGDYIMFFIPPLAHRNAQGTENEIIQSEKRTSSLDFGVIPSTVDSIPEAVAEAGTAQAKLEVYRDHFGALSEGGMSIEMLRAGDGSHFQTKLDVPFARLSYAEMFR